MVTPRRPPLGLAVAALIASVVSLFMGLRPAAAAEVTLTPVAPPQALIDGVDEEVENNTGEGVSARANDNPNTFAAEDDSTLGPGETIIYRLYGYDMTYPAEDCASYSVEVEMSVRADGPQVGTGDNMIMGVLDPDFEALAGSTHTSPTAVGESKVLREEFAVAAEDLRTGLLIAFGATTHQDAIDSGYTFETPEVTVTEDLGDCDLDSDGVADDVDPDNADPCVPDESTNACVESLATTPPATSAPTTTTTAPPTTSTPTEPVSANSARTPAALRTTG